MPYTPRYHQVNIGRNVDNLPMSDKEWDKFQDAVTSAILSAHRAPGAPNVSIHTGEGIMNATSPARIYSDAVASIRPNVNHHRTPDSDRRYVVTVNGRTTYTDSPARVARLTECGAVGSVIDRGA